MHDGICWKFFINFLHRLSGALSISCPSTRPHLEVLSYQTYVVDGSFERLMTAIRKLFGDDVESLPS